MMRLEDFDSCEIGSSSSSTSDIRKKSSGYDKVASHPGNEAEVEPLGLDDGDAQDVYNRRTSSGRPSKKSGAPFVGRQKTGSRSGSGEEEDNPFGSAEGEKPGSGYFPNGFGFIQENGVNEGKSEGGGCSLYAEGLGEIGEIKEDKNMFGSAGEDDEKEKQIDDLKNILDGFKEDVNKDFDKIPGDDHGMDDMLMDEEEEGEDMGKGNFCGDDFTPGGDECPDGADAHVEGSCSYHGSQMGPRSNVGSGFHDFGPGVPEDLARRSQESGSEHGLDDEIIQAEMAKKTLSGSQENTDGEKCGSDSVFTHEQLGHQPDHGASPSQKGSKQGHKGPGGFDLKQGFRDDDPGLEEEKGEYDNWASHDKVGIQKQHDQGYDHGYAFPPNQQFGDDEQHLLNQEGEGEDNYQRNQSSSHARQEHGDFDPQEQEQLDPLEDAVEVNLCDIFGDCLCECDLSSASINAKSSNSSSRQRLNGALKGASVDISSDRRSGQGSAGAPESFAGTPRSIPGGSEGSGGAPESSGRSSGSTTLGTMRDDDSLNRCQRLDGDDPMIRCQNLDQMKNSRSPCGGSFDQGAYNRIRMKPKVGIAEKYLCINCLYSKLAAPNRKYWKELTFSDADDFREKYLGRLFYCSFCKKEQKNPLTLRRFHDPLVDPERNPEPSFIIHDNYSILMGVYSYRNTKYYDPASFRKKSLGTGGGIAKLHQLPKNAPKGGKPEREFKNDPRLPELSKSIGSLSQTRSFDDANDTKPLESMEMSDCSQEFN